jgi:hypothetical protein
MAGFIVDNGEKVALEYLVNKVATTRNLILKLFKSNTTPSETTVVGDLTEADFTGYSAITLTGASWSISGTTPTQAAYAEQTFTSSADQSVQNVYGYYLVRATDGDLVAAERFTSGPYAISNLGDNIKVTPQITAANVV